MQVRLTLVCMNWIAIENGCDKFNPIAMNNGKATDVPKLIPKTITVCKIAQQIKILKSERTGSVSYELRMFRILTGSTIIELAIPTIVKNIATYLKFFQTQISSQTQNGLKPKPTQN